ARCARPGDPDRRSELDSRPGWAWTRLVRRYDDYERLLERLDAESERIGGDGARVPRRESVPAS
ncbi:MAG: hypothetical protein M3Y09_13635, partial [Actinomycetota bacterium]|nr:hypothetical protein [Actinomycetota bacterium]